MSHPRPSLLTSTLSASISLRLPPTCLSIHKELSSLSPLTPLLKAEWFHVSPTCSTGAKPPGQSRGSAILSTGCSTGCPSPPSRRTSDNTASGCCGFFCGYVSLCSLIHDASLHCSLHPTQHSLAQSASPLTPGNSTRSSLLKRPHLILLSQAPCRPSSLQSSHFNGLIEFPLSH